MLFNIYEFKTNTKNFNENFENAINHLKTPNYNLTLNPKAKNELSNDLIKAQKKRNENSKLYENNEKIYKVLKKYGEVLAKIEKLLGLIPDSLSHLSIDELAEKLDELSKTKQRNELQISFIFFQNLFTDTIKNLLTIEKSFQEGNTTSKNALTQVQQIKQSVEEQTKFCPKTLQTAKDEVNYLLTLYENSFKSTSKDNSLNNSPNLTKTDLNESQKEMLEKLHNNSESMLKRITNLTKNLADFEPQVNLSQLSKDLKNTEDLIDSPVWCAEDLNSCVFKLEITTDSLTEKQIKKNKQAEELSDEIKDLKELSVHENSNSYKEFAKETFKDAAKRAIQTKEIAIQIEELVSENGVPTTIGRQVANAILNQMDSDIDFCKKVEAKPESDKYTLDLTNTEKAIKQAEILKNKTLTLEEQQEMILKLMQEKEDEDGDGYKNS